VGLRMGHGPRVDVAVSRHSTDNRMMSEEWSDKTLVLPLPRHSAFPRSGTALTVASPHHAREAVQAVVDGMLAGRPKLCALEAGAGKRTRLELPDDAYVVGVDADPVAIKINPRLDERVVADLGEYAPLPASFDLITCWYVLEHVDDPGDIMDRLAGWTAPGGVVVLVVPNLRSPKSVLTKLTPHRFHVWFRRRVLGFPNAGRPGYGPYPTTLRREISPVALRRRFAESGLYPVFQVYFEDPKQVALRRRLRVTGWRWRIVRMLVRAVSLGRLDAARSEYAVVLRRDS